MIDRTDDTIVAISSPAGASVRGIVRLSGPEAVSLADRVFVDRAGASLAQAGGYRRVPGQIRMEPSGTVPAEAYLFRAPTSYTRQDIVELHTLGSPPLLAEVFARLLSLGARAAGPGEFTARAFFAGALDLTQVEAVAAMIHARGDAELRASRALLAGRLSEEIAVLRDRLADLLARVEAGIDFADEPIEFVTSADTIATIERTCADLNRLLQESASIERLEVLPQVLLVGSPNTGKSTLFNRLTGMDRVIQSATAGTTRDVIAAPLSLADGEVMLLDSAGLDSAMPSHEAASASLVALGQRATRQWIETADLLVVVVDVAASPETHVRELLTALADRPVLLVANKVDLHPAFSDETWTRMAGPNVPVVRVSALTGQGVDELRRRLGEMTTGTIHTGGSAMLMLSGRQRDALRATVKSLEKAHELCLSKTSYASYEELLALELRAAANALSLLTGEVVTEELLDRIFTRFCIGK